MQRDTKGVQCMSLDCLMATPPVFCVEKGKTEAREHRNSFGTVCMHLWADRQRRASHVVVERRCEKKRAFTSTPFSMCAFISALSV